MPELLGKIVSSAQAAAAAWRTYGVPGADGSPLAAAALGDPAKRRLRFALLASLYDGTAYRDEVGRKYREAQGLYAETRPIVNYVKALCDFYAAHVYAGPVSPDGARIVEGQDAALPLVTLVGGGQQSEAALRAAFGQLSYDWWAWDQWLPHRVRQTEILGSTLTEIVDDPATGKLSLATVWPGLVDEITLDAVGNVKGYSLEWTVQERGPIEHATGKRTAPRAYRYRKVVDGETFRHYRDDRFEREDQNPYGFVPAVWDRSLLGWGDWGEPAIHGSQAAGDELNELWSHANDRLHQMFAMPVQISGAQGQGDKAYGEATRTRVNVFYTPAAGQMSTVAFSLGEVLGSIDRVGDAIAAECPEVRVYDRIKQMSQVTGPGIRRAVADVEHRLNEKAARYDRQTVKLLQMGSAIAAMRLAEAKEGWASPTEQQRKFAPFGLDAYKSGLLDCMILPRELVKPTAMESIEEQAAIERLEMVASLRALGLPDAEIAAREEGWRARAERDAAAFTDREGAFALGDEPPMGGVG